MHLPEDFIPDYTSKLLTGLICNRYSSIQQDNNLSFISLFNRLNVWNNNTQELVLSYGTQKHRISCFFVNENFALIGYENGVVEIASRDEQKSIKVLKLHGKRVTQIRTENDLVISSSLDGTLCSYDVVLEEVRFYYHGNSSAIENFYVAGSKIVAICSDKSLKVWKIHEETLFDAFVFDGPIFDALGINNKAFVILKTGDSFLLDFQDKNLKNFEKFKNPRNLRMKCNKVIVQCQRKTSVFAYSADFNLTFVQRIASSPDFVNFDFFDEKIFFISKSNKIVCDGKINDFGYHQNQIVGMKIENNKIYTLSKDRFICWIRSQDNPFKDVEGIQADNHLEESMTVNRLDLQRFTLIKDLGCFDFFSDFVVFGGERGLEIYNKKFFELKSQVKAGKVFALAASLSVLAVCLESEVKFFNPSFEEIQSISTPDVVTHCGFNASASLFVCSCLDNKVYVFNYPSLDLKLSLYGHSLPVRSFDISEDSKMILTAGADKLIKLWGLEFGNCLKTYVGDSKNVKFLKDYLFMFCDNDLQYYNHFQKLRQFRTFSAGIVDFGSDFMVVTADKGLNLFSMNRYEFQKEDELSEIEEAGLRNMLSVREYDTFLVLLENLEKDANDASFEEFYKYLESADMTELKKYLFVLDHTFITLILKTLDRHIARNPIVNARILIHLFSCHSDTCLSMDLFYKLKEQILASVKKMREIFFINDARIEVEENGFYLENTE